MSRTVFQVASEYMAATKHAAELGLRVEEWNDFFRVSRAEHLNDPEAVDCHSLDELLAFLNGIEWDRKPKEGPA